MKTQLREWYLSFHFSGAASSAWSYV